MPDSLKIHPFGELALAGGLGAAAAISADLATSVDASLLHGFVQSIFGGMGLKAASVDLGYGSVFLMALGALSVLYFRPLSRKGAFFCGFSVIAAIAVVFP